MTVSSSNRKNTYSGDGATVVFPYTFRVLDEDHIIVQLKDNNGVTTTQTITTHYTVSGVGAAAGGNITFLTAPAATDTIILLRNMPFQQNTDYSENDAFPAETHEEALDELTMNDLQMLETLDRAVVMSPDVSGFTATMVDPSGDKYIKFNSDGTAFEAITLSTTAGLGNVVEDTSPQLGGILDCNSYHIHMDDSTGIQDDSGNDYLVFYKTASAVNGMGLTNAATGGSPTWAPVGTDANISVTWNTKGTGIHEFGADIDLNSNDLIAANVTATGSSTARSLENRFDEVVNVLDYGATGDGVTDDLTAITNAVADAKAAGKDLYLPAGTYLITASFPTRQAGTPSSLEDYNGMVVYGDGRSSIIKTSSSNGHDILQLNGVSNITFRDLAVTGVQTGTPSQGVNGCSITAGGTDILLENVHVFDIPWYDATTYVDGGKAFTIQPSTSVNEVSNIKIHNCSCSSSSGDTYTAFGFGMDIDGPTALGATSKAPKGIEVTGCHFECWYRGINISTAAHNGTSHTDPVLGAVSIGLIPNMDIKIHHNTTVGAQYGSYVGRGSGIQINNNAFISTGTGAPSTVAFDTLRYGMYVVAANFSEFNDNSIDYAACDDFIGVGGATGGSARADSWFLTVKGNKCTGATVGDGITAISGGGNYVRRSYFAHNSFTAVTGAEYNSNILTASYVNVVVHDDEDVSRLRGILTFPNSSKSVANTLDWFEDWTAFPTAPTLAGASVAGTQTYTTQVGRYCRIGNMVFFNIVLTLSAKDGTTSGNLLIKNLPYTSANTSNNIASVTFNYIKDIDLDTASSYYTVIGRILANNSQISLQEAGDNNTPASLTHADFGAATAIWCSGFYEV